MIATGAPRAPDAADNVSRRHSRTGNETRTLSHMEILAHHTVTMIDNYIIPSTSGLKIYPLHGATGLQYDRRPTRSGNIDAIVRPKFTSYRVDSPTQP